MILIGIVATIWIPWYFYVYKKSKNELKIKQC